MWLRYGLVPGWTDQQEHLHALGKHFRDYQTIEKVEILPYHQLGIYKWTALGMDYKLKGIEPPSQELKERTAAIFREYLAAVEVR